jgi:hypothetical protein
MPNHSASEYLRAVELATRADDRMAGRGGVRRQTVADCLGVTRNTAGGRLARLEDDGKLVRVWGVGEHGPACGWLPVGHPDAREGGERGHAPEVAADD